MTQAKAELTNSTPPSATLLNVNLRLLAPKLVCYSCELSALIESIEMDAHCSKAMVNYANQRSGETDNVIENVNHAVVYTGLIDSKQFLFSYLLLSNEAEFRPHLIKLLVRAKMCADLFITTGPLNKDLAFVATLLTGKKYLKIQKPETVYMLFKITPEQRSAIKNFDFGLRDTIKKVLVIEAKADPKSPKRAPISSEQQDLYQESVYWANKIVGSLV